MEVAKPQRASLGSLRSLPPDSSEPDPAYRAILDWIWSFSARPRAADEIAAQRAAKLDRMRALLAALDHPERRFESVLVAGTKGKGSTVAMVSSCLERGGLATGRYTSPHLVNWRERACINGEPISTHAVIALAEPVRHAINSLPAELGAPTTFEVGTAIAFLYFARERVAIAAIEVGTGGRFDATNLVEPLVSVITPISYDHTQTLGETLSSIGWHKAGILRSGRTAVLAPQTDEARAVVEREARAVGARLEEVGRDWRWSASAQGIRVESAHADFVPLETQVGLLGDHQRDNATTAVGALHALAHADARFALPPAVMQAGLAQVHWPGRFEILSRRPLVVLDGAHNGASAEALRKTTETVVRFDRLLLVIGLSEGKDARGVIGALVPRASQVYLTRSRHERAAEPQELLPLAREAAPSAETIVEPDLATALAAALAAARPDDMVLVTGSLFVVGEAMLWWQASRA